MFTMACLQNSSLQQSNLCACGKVIHNSHSYCTMPKRGKSSTVLRFWVKNTNPAELSVKIKDCWTYESVTNYLCEKAKFRSLGKKLPSDKGIRVSLWSLDVISDCTECKEVWLLLTCSQLILFSSRCLDLSLHHCHTNTPGTGLCAFCGWTKPLCLR